MVLGSVPSSGCRTGHPTCRVIIERMKGSWVGYFLRFGDFLAVQARLGRRLLSISTASPASRGTIPVDGLDESMSDVGKGCFEGAMGSLAGYWVPRRSLYASTLRSRWCGRNQHLQSRFHPLKLSGNSSWHSFF